MLKDIPQFKMFFAVVINGKKSIYRISSDQMPSP